MLVTSLVVTTALAWSGWRLVQQQRELDRRALRQEVDGAAEAFAADIRERLADEGERLDRWLTGSTTSIEGALPGTVGFLQRAADGVTDRSGAPPFEPQGVASHDGGAPDAIFAEAEHAEFALRQPAAAIALYRRLSDDPRPAIRAGALLRLGRVLRAQRDFPAAAAAATDLAGLGNAVVAGGVPAELAGLDALRLTHAASGDPDRARAAAAQMLLRLDAGAWPLSQTTAEFYREMVSDAPPAPQWHLAAALAEAWAPLDRTGVSPRGVKAIQTPAGAALAWWRVNASGRAVAVTFADPLLRSSSPASLAWRVSDAEDRPFAGSTDTAGGPIVATHAVGGGAGWSLQVWPTASAPAPGGSAQALLLAALGGTLVFVWAAAALMLRALGREARVAQLQSDFVAAVSHEFRSPLTAMRQMTEMLDADRVPDEPRRRQYYRLLAGEVARLQHLVETLLDFGRMEAGRTPAARAPIDLDALVNSVVEDVRRQPRAADARFELVPPTRPVPLEGDADALRLALRNLVENAVKYSPGGARVTIRWALEGGSAVIAVADRGLGIAPHEHARVFGKFVRGESAAAAHVGGAGVGLAMVRQVVNAHHGDIRLESRPGEGSTFTIRLPLSAAGQAET